MTSMAGRARASKPNTLEQRLWDAADALHGNQEPSEYKYGCPTDLEEKAVERVLEPAELFAVEAGAET
jgi:hypothetical protein